MIPAVTQRPRARMDLLEQFVYFGETADAALAERYFGPWPKPARCSWSSRMLVFLMTQESLGLPVCAVSPCMDLKTTSFFTSHTPLA